MMSSTTENVKFIKNAPYQSFINIYLSNLCSDNNINKTRLKILCIINPSYQQPLSFKYQNVINKESYHRSTHEEPRKCPASTPAS